MLSTVEALRRVLLKDPWNEVVRREFADAILEADEPGADDWIRASAKLIQLSQAKREYKTVPARTDSLDGEPLEFGTARRALPGWRDWLGTAGQWFRLDGKPLHADGFPSFAVFHKELVPEVMNWHRCLPSLWKTLQGHDRWRRTGSFVEVWITGGRYQNAENSGAFRIEFSGGFVRRCEFSRWYVANRYLPFVLVDQPLVEPGLRDQPYKVGETWYIGGRFIQIGGLREWLNAASDSLAPAEFPSGKERARRALALGSRWRTLELHPQIAEEPREEFALSLPSLSQRAG